jgi:hypothetical protein
MIYFDAIKKVGISPQKLLTSRLSIIGQSGSGKSYAVAVICESLCEAGLGFLIIDTEGEYFSLKEKYDLLWGSYSSAGDIDLKKVNISRLAHHAIKQSVPVIFDVSEAMNPKAEVSRLCKALYEQATNLKIPYLLIVEEADKFCPQRGVCIPELEEISRRGRKRGLGLLVASQRPALINKAVLSQCNIQLIGKLTIDNDIDSVRPFINNRVLLYKLPDFKPGEFILSGLGKDLVFRFKRRLTPHKSSSPPLRKLKKPEIKEVITKLGFVKPIISEDEGLGVSPQITLSQAKSIANSISKKKYLIIGKKEEVVSVNLLYEPLIELKVRVLKKTVLKKESFNDYYIYFNDYFVVNEKGERLYDLRHLKGLSYEEVKILVELLYSRGLKTIKSITKDTGFSEDLVRKTVSSLEDKKLVLNIGKRGRVNTYEPLKRIDIPYLKSMAIDRMKTRTKPEVTQEARLDLGSIINIIKSINRKAEVLESKTLYFPFYEIVLKRDDKTRHLLINGLTGKVK